MGVKIAFCILLAIGIAAAAYVGGSDAVCYAGLSGEGGRLDPRQWIGAAFLLSCAIIALAYMLSHASENEQLSVWAKEEAFNLGISVLVLVGFIALTIGSCTLLSGYSRQQEVAGVHADANPFATSYRYLDALSKRGIREVESQTRESLQKQLEATKFIYFGWPALVSKGVSTHASLRALSSHKEMLIDLTLPIVVSIEAQKGAIQLIELVGMAVIVPFAVIMRLVPFTRNAGNFMLAIAFALFVVVPAAYVLSAAAWKGVESPKDAQGNAVNPLADGSFTFRDRAIGLSCSELEYDCKLYRVASILPQGIFMPNLVIVLVVTCVMGFSRALSALQM